MKSAFSFLLLTSILAPGCAHQKYDIDPSYHFGEIKAPCAVSPNNCKINEDLRLLDECRQIDGDCCGGNQLLDDLFGKTRHAKFANYIVYFDQRKAPGTFADHQPILMWNRKNTRYLYGAQEVYVLLFTEYKSCLSAQITTIARRDTNPFDAVLKALGKSLGPTDTPTVLATHPAELVWYPLSGDTEHPIMWLAIGALPVDTNTTDWITVKFTNPKVVSKPIGKEDTQNSSQAQQGDKTTPIPDGCAVDPSAGWLPDTMLPPATTYKAGFLAHNAFFSNNRESHVGVAVAFGLTLTGQKAGPGGNNPDLNGYALAKFYPFPHFVPRLVTEPNSTGGAIAYERPSIGIVLGTNIGSPGFNELVAGISFGHLVGNVGLIAGVNEFVPAKPAASAASTGSTAVTRRRGRPFVGLEYAF